MSLSLAQKNAWSLAKSLMVSVTLSKAVSGYSVTLSAESTARRRSWFKSMIRLSADRRWRPLEHLLSASDAADGKNEVQSWNSQHDSSSNGFTMKCGTVAMKRLPAKSSMQTSDFAPRLARKSSDRTALFNTCV